MDENREVREDFSDCAMLLGVLGRGNRYEDSPKEDDHRMGRGGRDWPQACGDQSSTAHAAVGELGASKGRPV